MPKHILIRRERVLKASTSSKLSRLFWGQMEGADLPKRVAGLVFTKVAGDPVYVVLTIAPLMMGAVLFGPAMATLLGLYSGAVVFAHASLFPLDFYELYYFTNPFATLVAFTCLGALAGCAFHLVFKRFAFLSQSFFLFF